MSIWHKAYGTILDSPPPCLLQESGRAGRDGLPSWARVYYGRQDRDAAAFIMNMEVRCWGVGGL